MNEVCIFAELALTSTDLSITKYELMNVTIFKDGTTEHLFQQCGTIQDVYLEHINHSPWSVG